MGLVVFDIGGTAVKYGFWSDNNLIEQNKFVTPTTFEEMSSKMKEIVDNFRSKGVSGVGISAPGAVNPSERKIDGISAVPYLHGFPIYDALEDAFGVPITIENDANCAGIAEIELGAGKDAKHAVFLVLGTGVGGSIFINREIYTGSHLFGGEFGLLRSDSEHTLSEVGTIVKVADAYKAQTGKEVNGKEIFELVEAGDILATKLVEKMYDAIAQGIYNIQVSIDPELIIIGGGISARKEIAEIISKRVYSLLEERRITEVMPEIKTCEFSNDSNLIGAAMNFIKLN